MMCTEPILGVWRYAVQPLGGHWLYGYCTPCACPPGVDDFEVGAVSLGCYAPSGSAGVPNCNTQSLDWHLTHLLCGGTRQASGANCCKAPDKYPMPRCAGRRTIVRHQWRVSCVWGCETSVRCQSRVMDTHHRLGTGHTHTRLARHWIHTLI